MTYGNGSDHPIQLEKIISKKPIIMIQKASHHFNASKNWCTKWQEYAKYFVPWMWIFKNNKSDCKWLPNFFFVRVFFNCCRFLPTIVLISLVYAHFLFVTYLSERRHDKTQSVMILATTHNRTENCIAHTSFASWTD